MNWEPMTEDAVFGEFELVLVHTEYGEYFVGNRTPDERFVSGNDWDYPKYEITHFARITNPNEEKP